MASKEKTAKRQIDSPEESGLGLSGDVTPTTQPETELIVPPDGGWGWVVVAASFLCNMLVDGIVYSCGLLLGPINETFQVSEAKMAFVSSLLSGFYLLAGPFVSALANRYGFRMVTIIGSVVASVAFALSYFANSVMYLYLVFGVLGGIGLSMIYIPAVITVGFYFERWRALATGISMCGSGVGTFLFAPIATVMLTSLDWRGTILCLAAIILCCIIFGSLFRPLKPTKVTIAGSSTDVEDNKTPKLDKHALLMKIQQKSDSGFVFPIDMQNKATPHTWMGVAPNEKYPTAAEVFKKSLTDLEMRRSSANSAVIKSHMSNGNGHVKPPKFLTVAVTEKDETLDDNSSENIKTDNTEPLLNETAADNMNGDSRDNGERRHTVTSRYPKEQNRSRRGTLTGETSVSRPMYREDIFFGGSLKRLPQYQSRTSVGYHMSVTHLPTVEDVAEEQEAKCSLCPEAVKRTLVTMLDFSLLRSPSFMLLAVSGFFSMLGFFVPIIYVTKRALDGGMPESSTIWLVSAIGIANTVGRVLCGILSSIKGVNALWINNIAITVGGIATIFSGMSYSVVAQFTYCVIFGLSIACLASLRSILVVDLMGLEKLTNAFGLLMMFQGIAVVIGAPIAGVFMDYTGSYDVSFYIAGGLYLFSGLLCFPLSYLNEWEKSRSVVPIKKKPAII